MKIIQSGLQAAKPELYLSKYVYKNRLVCGTRNFDAKNYDKISVVAVGKAADSMTKAFCKIIPKSSGIIVIPKNYTPTFNSKKFKIIKSGHPTPNKNSTLAASKIIQLLRKTTQNNLVVFLISGGSSALVCAPAGVSLEHKIKTTQVLLESGASILEINAIRKHLSGVKGGKILEHLNCTAISYVMSDVVNDDLGSIGSGLVYCDKTTFSDCLGIVDKYKLHKKLPKSVLVLLHKGAQGKIAETPKRPKIQNQIIANNSNCLGVMVQAAKKLGYSTLVYPRMTGNVKLAANKILKLSNSKNCVIFGGETTVQVTGKGKGGRNQELVLHMIPKLSGKTVASIGTDGIDGNTKHAGAIFSGTVNYDIQPYLKNNDSNSFFAKYGGLIKTGPTHTNLLDIGVILKHL
ncbi:MAG: glycerate kinase [Candidatus Nitrosotenuis sp.]